MVTTINTKIKIQILSVLKKILYIIYKYIIYKYNYDLEFIQARL